MTEACRHRVLRAAELQSDDYHMNRALYYACRDDREHFCHSVESGKGRVYACLMKNKFHPEMSNEVSVEDGRVLIVQCIPEHLCQEW